MKIALCAAQGLTFLHEEGPFQVLYTFAIFLLYKMYFFSPPFFFGEYISLAFVVILSLKWILKE